MSNLENEYKNLMNRNVPDLWSRIEAGLEPKEDSSVTNEPDNIVTVDFDREYEKKKTNVINKKYVKTFTGIAVACIIVFASRNVISLMISGFFMKSSDMAMSAGNSVPYGSFAKQEYSSGHNSIFKNYSNSAYDNFDYAEAPAAEAEVDISEGVVGSIQDNVYYDVTVIVSEVTELDNNEYRYSVIVDDPGTLELDKDSAIELYADFNDDVLDIESKYVLCIYEKSDDEGQIKYYIDPEYLFKIE